VISAGIVVISVVSKLNVLLYYHLVWSLMTHQVDVTSGNVTTYITQNYTYYTYEYPFLISTEVNGVWETVYYFVRDLVILIAILVLNILILRVISQMVKTRRALFRNDGGAENATVKATRMAEKRKMIMILLTGVNFCAGHVISFVFRVVVIFVPFEDSTSYFMCLFFLTDLFLNLSFATAFLFYYFFNKRFEKEMKTLLLFNFVGEPFFKKMDTPYIRFVAPWFLYCDRILKVTGLIFRV
jgi:hypothetical protein